MKILTGIIALLLTATSLAQDIRKISIADLVKEYKHAEGVVVVNFWSTWCKPCIAEIPHFLKVADKYKRQGVELWLVSQDTKSIYESGSLKKWLAARNWQAQHYWLNETNADYYCPMVDESWSGVIPATVVINPRKNFFRFVESELPEAKLEALIQEALQ